MNISLSGKQALVCGSTQGIGLAIAKELAVCGANCILMARDEEALKKAVQGLDRNNQQKHEYLVADFSDPDKVQEVINNFIQTTIVHVLVNNSGGPKFGPLIEEEGQKFVDAFKQHVVCNQLLAKAVVPGMKSSGYGRIINIISTSVRIPIINLGVSNTIRAAVASWSKSLANEIGGSGITVNNILPGFTSTNRLKALLESTAAKRGVEIEQVAKEMKERIPLKRFGEPAETAAVAAFLASPAASYVNGVSIPVDGGGTGTI